MLESFRSVEESSPETDLPPGLKLALALDDLQRRRRSGDGEGEGGSKYNGSHAFVRNKSFLARRSKGNGGKERERDEFSENEGK